MHGRKNIKMYTCLHVKYPLFLSDFNEPLTSSAKFQIILKHQISRKPLLFRADKWKDGRTGETRRSWESLFTILRTRLETKRSGITHLLCYFTAVVPHNCKACTVHIAVLIQRTLRRWQKAQRGVVFNDVSRQVYIASVVDEWMNMEERRNNREGKHQVLG